MFILYYVLHPNSVKTASCEKFLVKIFYVKDIVKIFLLNIPSLFNLKKIIYKSKKKKAEIYGIYRYFVKNVYTVRFFLLCVKMVDNSSASYYQKEKQRKVTKKSM